MIRGGWASNQAFARGGCPVRKALRTADDMGSMRSLPVLLFALMAAVARAGIPAGGMDLIADHWLTEYEPAHATEHRPGSFGEGPLRLSIFGVSIGGIANNTGNASTMAGIFASERHLAGRWYAGGSFGQGTSSSLKWSHGEVHVGALLSEQMALRVGYNNDQYDYPGNLTDDANVAQNLMRGACVGVDLFGSPKPGWFVQLSGDVLPLRTERTDGAMQDPRFTVRGSFMIGTSLFYNLDLSLVGIAVPRLGDSGSNAGHLGGGVSLTF